MLAHYRFLAFKMESCRKTAAPFRSGCLCVKIKADKFNL